MQAFISNRYFKQFHIPKPAKRLLRWRPQLAKTD